MRAVEPIYMPFESSPDKTIAAAELYLTKNHIARPGSRLIIVTDMFAGEDRFDSIQLRPIR
jgi:pyruvate kinase